MKEVDIVFALTGDLFRNSRALKQIGSLSSAGYTVAVLHLKGDSAPFPLGNGLEVHSVEVASGSGPAYFNRVHRAFSGSMEAFKARLYHASDLYVLAACRRAADSSGTKYTYDSREYYPHVASTAGRPWARWWWSRLEAKHIRAASAIFTVSDSIADALSVDYGIERPVLVQNFPVMRDAGSSDAKSSGSIRKDLGLGDQTLILHLGQMKAARGCENLVRAMPRVRDAHLVFLGYGPLSDELKNLTTELDLTHRVHFLPPVKPDTIQEYIESVDIGVTLLRDTCLNHRYALPNKLFDYIHAGIPVLGADLDEVNRLVETHEIGMTADSARPGQIARRLNEMIESPHREGWKINTRTVSETFRWEYASQRMMHPIRRILDV